MDIHEWVAVRCWSNDEEVGATFENRGISIVGCYMAAEDVPDDALTTDADVQTLVKIKPLFLRTSVKAGEPIRWRHVMD